MAAMNRVPSVTAVHSSPAPVPASEHTATPACDSVRMPAAPASPADAPAPLLLQSAGVHRSEPADANPRPVPASAAAILQRPVVHSTGSAVAKRVRAEFGSPSCQG